MKEMLVFKIEKYIHCPLEVVFDYINDDEKIEQWNTLYVENIYHTKDNKKAYEKGTVFTSVQKIQKKTFKLKTEITQYNPPYEIIMHSYSKEGTTITKYILRRSEQGTILTLECRLIPSNYYYKVVTKLFGWSMKFIMEEQIENLHALLETMDFE
ncbi:SRPBCC domain-containing protein (plasmid) [Bacillus carboniphilus]|uniref:SRPBCC domain-containing protein n=1 Tax=Bacillus carboniphilus TaxID=86663 RepID=A0ABY9JYM1_9BACI|nr:SRPBCC domain-containing protein [Bacillus carboniphilus]WLR44496.1 SRPBCC domain-containing protein [Bacillus carboniphilus]